MLCWVTQSCPALCDAMDCSPPGSFVFGDSPGKNTGVGCHALLQGIFPSQGWNPGISHCRQILYGRSHQGSPRILEWVASPSSRGTSQPRNWTGSLALQVDALPAKLPGNLPFQYAYMQTYIRKITHEWTWQTENLYINKDIKESLLAYTGYLIPKNKISRMGAPKQKTETQN